MAFVQSFQLRNNLHYQRILCKFIVSIVILNAIMLYYTYACSLSERGTSFQLSAWVFPYTASLKHFLRDSLLECTKWTTRVAYSCGSARCL